MGDERGDERGAMIAGRSMVIIFDDNRTMSMQNTVPDEGEVRTREVT